MDRRSAGGDMGGGRARPILRSLALFVGLGSLAACGAPAPSAPAGPAPTRETHDLGGPWEVWLDREGVGLRDDWVAALTAGRRPAGAPGQPLTLGVPGPLEADSATLDYDGIAFYVRRFEAPPGAEGSRGLLRFGQVNYACRVWLDGAPVGEHEGGYEAFSFDLTGRLGPGPHVLVVRVVDPGAEPVDGLTLAATPHAKESWYENSGGLLGPVSLELVRGWSLREGSLTVLVDATAGQERVMLSGELLAPPGGHAAEAPFALRLRPADGAEDSGRRIEQRLAVSGQATPFFVELWARGAARWSPESPALHRITLHAGGELVAERTIGFRTLSIEGGDFRIDGVRRTLKGVLWQPHHTGTGGVTPPDDELRATARAIRETGFDLVRAHVRPAPPAFLDECDRIGLLVLEEPAIGWVQDDPGLRERLLREVSWMVERDRHHPAIVLWGVLNELSGQAWRHADALVERVASLDGTRPVLEDSGAFLGQGRVRPPGAAASIPMIDRHAYPPYPLPIEERDALLGLRGLEGGLVFVSEFGYGALLDTEAALRPFTEAGRMTAERIKFASWAGLARRSRQAAPGASGPEWWQRDWTAEAARVQADATEDLIDALRANPEVDLLCLTQWQAASEESSAGLLDPWGQPRPALAAARRALAPVRVITIPECLSVLAGQPFQCRVVVSNQTDAPVAFRWLEYGESRLVRSHQSFDPGVDAFGEALEAPQDPGAMELDAVCFDGDPAGHRSARHSIRVVAGPSPELGRGLAYWSPDDGAPRGLDRWGFARGTLDALASGDPPVIVLADAEALRSRLSLGDWLRVWEGVHRGGAAVVLVPGPAATEASRALGLLRGVQTHTGLPLPVSVASAPGNFMGRVHVVREGDGARLLGRGDEAFSPEGMLVDPPRGSDARMVTLGWLGNLIGTPDVVLSFGRGTIRVIGLPLLRPVGGAVDPSRDEQLAGIVLEAGEQARARLAAAAATPGAAPATWSPPLAADLERLQTWLDRLDRFVALGDRQSPFAGGEPALPEPVAAALESRTGALEALFEGDTARGIALLEAAVAPLWSDSAQRFLDREAAVLQEWTALVAAGGEERWNRAHAVRQEWVAAVAAWFRGEAGPAQAGIDRAWELLQAR